MKNMPRQSSVGKKLLLGLSIFVAAWCIWTATDSWMHPGWLGAGYAVAIGTLGVGNIICLLLNYAYSKLAGSPRWVKWLLAVQLLVAVVFCMTIFYLFAV
jgi:hypothetical protein